MPTLPPSRHSGRDPSRTGDLDDEPGPHASSRHLPRGTQSAVHRLGAKPNSHPAHTVSGVHQLATRPTPRPTAEQRSIPSDGAPRRPSSPPPLGDANLTARDANAAQSLITLPEPEHHELRRRFVGFALLRTVLFLVGLGISFWVATKYHKPDALWGLVVLTALTVGTATGYGIALRRGTPVRRIAHVQMLADVSITTLLIWLTGGAESPYVLMYALSVVAAGATRYRRGAMHAAMFATIAFAVVGVLVWFHVPPIQMAIGIRPWELGLASFLRAYGLNLALLVGVGALGYILAEQLEQAAASLETERRTVGDLYTLHQDIVQSLSSGLVTANTQGTILTANAAACEFLGYDAASMQGRSLRDVLPGLDEKLGTDPRAELRRSDLTLRVGGADRTIGVSVSPLYDVSDVIIGRVVNFSDLTELRRMELHMRRAERLATVGQLAAGVAHEIRNPLAAISGSIELLRQSPQSTGDDRSLMEIVIREIDRLNTLITELLDYANPRPRQIAEFDAAVLVEETVFVAQQDRAHDVRIESNIATQLTMRADAAKLRQVFWNLLRNATDAAAAGGKRVEVSASRRGEQVSFAFADNGPGIAPAQLAHIFDPFFTTKKQGTGLGLATCHAIVTEHGGRIDVHSVVGQGTTMMVILPRQASDPRPDIGPSASDNATPLQT